jgi:hypothetical protein
LLEKEDVQVDETIPYVDGHEQAAPLLQPLT